MELLDVRRRNSVKYFMGGKKIVPLCCAAPGFLSFAVHGLLASRRLEASPELATAIGVNIFDSVSMHIEIFDGLLHGEGGIVLVLQEEYQ